VNPSSVEQRVTPDAAYNRSAKGQARHRRYEQSEKGRQARRRYAQSELRKESNRRRIFVGALYVGMESAFPYPREVVERGLNALMEEFLMGQAQKREEVRVTPRAVSGQDTPALLLPG
jgi:hypothetical protein